MKKDGNQQVLVGKFTMHGVTKDVSLPATVKVSPGHVQVNFHRRAHLPIVIGSGLFAESPRVPWWNNAKLSFHSVAGQP